MKQAKIRSIRILNGGNGIYYTVGHKFTKTEKEDIIIGKITEYVNTHGTHIYKIFSTDDKLLVKLTNVRVLVSYEF